MLMNAHPQVASIGELANSIGMLIRSGKTDQYFCSCDMEIKQCKFWKKVKNRCSEEGVELDLHSFDTNLDIGLGKNINRVLFGLTGRFPAIESFRDRFLWQIPGFRHIITRVIDRNLVIARAILDITDKKIFFDASKDLRRAIYLTKNENLEFKLIHLVKDVRGFLNSSRKRSGAKYFKKAVSTWIRTHRAALRIKSSLPGDAYLLVKYERLCEDTSETLADIFRFLDVDPVDLVSTVNKQSHHIIGNSMRRRSFNGLQLDEEWKKYLTPQQVAECMRLTGELSVALSYTSNDNTK